jgi:hypothetical protein
MNEENQIKLSEILANAIAQFEARTALAHNVLIFTKE